MMLLTAELRKKLPKLGTSEKLKDATAQIKFFTPWGRWTWYGIEFDGKDTFFGYVVGNYKEYGYFSLKELQSVKGPVGLKIERDRYFKPTKMSQVIKLP